MSTKHQIIIPLYDHTTREEAEELAAELERVFGLAQEPRVEGYPEPESIRARNPNSGEVETGRLVKTTKHGWHHVDFGDGITIRVHPSEVVAKDATPRWVSDEGRATDATGPYPTGSRCICYEMGATGPGQRHTLCRAHDEEGS